MEVKLVLVAALVDFASCLIVPQELSSLLSLAYSNIPPIKKGTDSRVGFGFALGNHADFQVLFEVGPQTNTAPIGSSFATNSKRHASTPPPNNNRAKFEGSEANKFLQRWAEQMQSGPNPASASQGLEPYNHRPIPHSGEVTVAHLQEQKPGEFLNLEDAMVELEKNEKGQYEIKQPPPAHIPIQVLYQLKKLYNQNADRVEEKPLETQQNPKQDDLKDNYERLSQFNVRQRTPEDVKKITADLSNVDLD